MKTVIITGANGNLGGVVTENFLKAGYQVIATVANIAAKKDLAHHQNLSVQAVDLTNEEETAAFVTATISKYQKVDAALMLVGGFAKGTIADTAGAELQKQFSLNFETAYYITRPLFRHMMQNANGRLVYIGSRPALQAADGKDLVAYGLAKSLLFKLAEYLNEAAKGKNVTATVVVPSTLDTALNRQYMPDINPDDWVKPGQLADIMEFIISDTGKALREPVLKVYNNS